MEELSIEEKAKRFDEAIERARDLLAPCTDIDRKARIFNIEDIEHLFPELVESESERTRKEIIRFIKWEVEDETVGNKWLAWLEKHKDYVSPQMVADAYLRGCNDTEKKWLEKQDE